MLKTSASFSVIQRILHWIVALLVFFNLLFTDDMDHWAHLFFKGESVSAGVVSSANIHAYVGMSVLVLGSVRLILRFIQGVPTAHEAEPRLFKTLSTIGHWTFYVLFIAMPLSGMMGYYLGIHAAAFVHGGPLKALMWCMIIVHVVAVGVHQFYWKTGLLKRMTTG